MFRSCRSHFRCVSQMKITKPELFRNALKIILVGTGNVLSPHKNFQFERTLKNVVMNSENAFSLASWRSHLEGLFGIFLDSHLFGLGQSSRRKWHAREGTSFGGALGVAGHGWWSSLELHMASHFSHKTLICDLKHGFFW